MDVMKSLPGYEWGFKSPKTNGNWPSWASAIWGGGGPREVVILIYGAAAVGEGVARFCQMVPRPQQSGLGSGCQGWCPYHPWLESMQVVETWPSKWNPTRPAPYAALRLACRVHVPVPGRIASPAKERGSQAAGPRGPARPRPCWRRQPAAAPTLVRPASRCARQGPTVRPRHVQPCSRFPTSAGLAGAASDDAVPINQQDAKRPRGQRPALPLPNFGRPSSASIRRICRRSMLDLCRRMDGSNHRRARARSTPRRLSCLLAPMRAGWRGGRVVR